RLVISDKATVISRNTPICANNVPIKVNSTKIGNFLMLRLLVVFIDYFGIFQHLIIYKLPVIIWRYKKVPCPKVSGGRYSYPVPINCWIHWLRNFFFGNIRSEERR